ncbi:MAG: DUF3473 domain-containing protein [Deltaproteobacteria bacterium]|nr:DUF3473 domain-containing protein [Deltaproteobacteria bacterium]
MLNALTIDVEDYFMVSGFAEIVKYDDWPLFESRIERNTHRILDLFDEHGVQATFFVLGWVAEHYPGLVAEISRRGHELASHSYRHRLAYGLSKREFREDTRASKRILEDISGKVVLGYRAPSYSVTNESLWVLEVLVEEGFSYDSSIFPIRHDRYGIPGFKRFPGKIKNDSGEILEVPLSTVRLLGNNIPIAGGGYLRLFPVSFIEWGIRSLNDREAHPAIVYLHPWELDPGQPKINGSRLSVFRHNLNMRKTYAKLNRLLESFRFGPIREVFADSI